VNHDQTETVNEVNALVERAMNAVRNTVGFAECTTSGERKQFEAGARVALAKMAILTIPAIEAHKIVSGQAKTSSDAAVRDLQTIVQILKKYDTSPR
jgi:transcriptional regulator of heat shock response